MMDDDEIRAQSLRAAAPLAMTPHEALAIAGWFETWIRTGEVADVINVDVSMGDLTPVVPPTQEEQEQAAQELAERTQSHRERRRAEKEAMALSVPSIEEDPDAPDAQAN